MLSTSKMFALYFKFACVVFSTLKIYGQEQRGKDVFAEQKSNRRWLRYVVLVQVQVKVQVQIQVLVYLTHLATIKDATQALHVA